MFQTRMFLLFDMDVLCVCVCAQDNGIKRIWHLLSRAKEDVSAKIKKHISFRNCPWHDFSIVASSSRSLNVLCANEAWKLLVVINERNSFVRFVITFNSVQLISWTLPLEFRWWWWVWRGRWRKCLMPVSNIDIAGRVKINLHWMHYRQNHRVRRTFEHQPTKPISVRYSSSRRNSIQSQNTFPKQEIILEHMRFKMKPFFTLHCLLLL